MLTKTINGLSAKYLNMLRDICNIESPTYYKEGIDKVGEYIIRLAEKKGWDIEVLELENAGNPICITMNKDASLEPIVFSGHIDTVHPLGLFPTPAVTVDGDKMYGPGVADCKGGVISSLLAMDALEACGFKSRPVKLIIQTDEETGSRTSGKKTVEFMVEKSRGAIAFLNTEEISANNTVTLSRKGIARFEFTLHGVAGHSAKCSKEGASAILEAAHKIIELEKFKDEHGITCNCGVISGGSVANTVPEECKFTADFRYATIEQLDEIKKNVNKIAEAVYTKDVTCDAEQISDRPCMPVSKRNFDLFDRINEIYETCGLPALNYRHGLGGSDAAYITIADIPCIDSIGVYGGKVHSVEEYVVTKSIAEAALRLACIAANI